MFREMRRSDRSLNAQEIESILEKVEYGFLSTEGDNNYPHTVPISYVYANNAIYIHCAGQGYKIDNMKRNSKVCFAIVGDTEVIPEKFSTAYQSVIVYGITEIVYGDEKKKALEHIIDKYSKEFKEQGMEYINKAIDMTTVVKINIEKFTGKGRGK